MSIKFGEALMMPDRVTMLGISELDAAYSEKYGAFQASDVLDFMMLPC